MCERQLIRNSITTPDGTVLVSRHRHDYVTHVDKNGYEYMVDGGNNYLRRNLCDIPHTDTSLYTDDDHELLRKEITWGTYGGKDGEMKYIPISQMSRAHINNIIGDGYKGRYVELMKSELRWRDDNEKCSIQLEIQRENSYG